jgi:hypothetical protein
MSQILRLKRSDVAGKIPQLADLQLGEIAVNTNDGKLFTKTSVMGVESVVDISASTNSPAFTGIPTGPTAPPGTSTDQLATTKFVSLAGAVVNSPVNVLIPSITGQAQVGATLTCSVGTWSNAPTSFHYQWFGNGVAIPFANSATLVVTSTYLAGNIYCVVTAANAGGSQDAYTEWTTLVQPAGLIPVNSALPTISGITTEGQTLTCSTGTWSNTPTNYSYQWQRGTTNILGETASTYVLAALDIGTTVRCQVTAVNSVGTSSEVTTNTAIIIVSSTPLPINTILPVITGIIASGQTLTCSTGTWSNTPTSYTYQWQRGTTNISGETAATHIAVAADIGQTLRCQVTAVNAGGSASVFTITTAVIGSGTPVNISSPTISAPTGSVAVGTTFTVVNGSWSGSPSSYSYQWFHQTADHLTDTLISGATSTTYTLVNADIGFFVYCQVTAINASGSTAASSNLSSSSFVVFLNAPVITVSPSVSGSTVYGSTLSCSTGTWLNSPTSYNYQWVRAGVDIPTATLSTYTIVLADVGLAITCRVTAINVTGPTSVVASNSITPAAATGQVIFTSVSSIYTYWTVPDGVTSVSMVGIGGGGGGAGFYNSNSAGGGGGGALAYHNNIPVTPGEVLIVGVGAGGNQFGHLTDGTTTHSGLTAVYRVSTSETLISAGGGKNGDYGVNTAGHAGGAGGIVYFGLGGNGGAGASNPVAAYKTGGGGGAGGYSGNGGKGGNATSGAGAPLPGTGGGGGGGQQGGSASYYGGGGGGVGLYGQGTSGAAAPLTNIVSGAGGAGKGGSNAPAPSSGYGFDGNGMGGLYGGGGSGGSGAPGAVRIIWGTGKSFPLNAA